jgi:hypothetical protein
MRKRYEKPILKSVPALTRVTSIVSCPRGYIYDTGVGECIQVSD